MIPFIVLVIVLPVLGLAFIGWVLYKRYASKPAAGIPEVPACMLEPSGVPGPNRIEHGRWFAIERCPTCKHKLSHEDIFDNGGVCPHCGLTNDTQFAQTEKVTLRRVTTYDSAGLKISERAEEKQ